MLLLITYIGKYGSALAVLRVFRQILRAEDVDLAGEAVQCHGIAFPHQVPQQHQRRVALLDEILGNGKVHAAIQQKMADALVDVVADHMDRSLFPGAFDCRGAGRDIVVCHIDAPQVGILLDGVLYDGSVVS